MAHGILVYWLGIAPRPWAVSVWSPNHWTATEFPGMYFIPSSVCRSFNLKLLSYLSPLVMIGLFSMSGGLFISVFFFKFIRTFFLFRFVLF